MSTHRFGLVGYSFLGSVELNFARKQEDLLLFASDALKKLKYLKKSSVVPLPEDAPKEIPRLMLFSEDGSNVLSISEKNFSFSFVSLPNIAKPSFEDKKLEIERRTKEIIELIKEKAKIGEVDNLEFSANLLEEGVGGSVDLMKNTFLNSRLRKKDLYHLTVSYNIKFDKPIEFLKRVTVGSLRKRTDRRDSGLNLIIALSTNLRNRNGRNIKLSLIDSLMEKFVKMVSNPTIDFE